MTIVQLEHLAKLDKMPNGTAVAVGLGGAGNDLLTHIMDMRPQGLRCIALDTDLYSLEIARAHSKLLIRSANDIGTKGDASVGRKLGLQVTDQLPSLLGSSDIVFILAGMGGGTGGGIAPLVAESARRNGALVVGVVTKPFHHEHERFSTAVDSVRRMTTACDTLVLVENHAVDQSTMTLPFGMSVDATGQIVDSIINSLTHAFTASTLCDTELGEFQTMLRRGGLAGGSLGYSHSQLGAEEAMLKVLRHSTAHGYLAKANGVFIEIASGAQIKRQHVESSMNLISSQIAPHAQLVCGQRTDPALRGMTQVTLLGTGLPFPVSWRGYRKLPLELHDLEAESGEEEQLALDLKLYQLESYAT